MEVHHPQDSPHKKKGWKEYFFEFFMLFLAVSAGFLMENIREHYVEGQRAHELAQSMLEDIKKDKEALQLGITLSDKKLIAADSILVLLHSPRKLWNEVIFYSNMVPIISAYPFIPTDGTYTEMKASGALRYFKQSLVNLMNGYDVQLKKTQFRDNFEERVVWMLADVNLDNMNFEVVSDIRFNKPVIHSMYLKFSDQSVTDRYINLVVTQRIFRMRTREEYREQLRIADKLIEALQKEYHLN